MRSHIALTVLSFHLTLMSVTSMMMKDDDPMQQLHSMEWDEWAKCREQGKCPPKGLKSFRSKKPNGVPCIGGQVQFADVSYACRDMNLLSFLSFDELGTKEAYEEHWHHANATMGNDVWGLKFKDRLYVIAGLMDGSSIVDVTNPLDPVVVAWVPSNADFAIPWRDVKVYKHYLYIVSDYWAPGETMGLFHKISKGNHGIQIVDMEGIYDRIRDPHAAEFTPLIVKEGVDGYKVIHPFDDAHNLIVNEDSGYLYAVATETVECKGGIQFLNLEDPMSPQLEGCISELGEMHDAHCVTYKEGEYRGKEICFTANLETKRRSWAAIDVTDKSNPVILSVNPVYLNGNYSNTTLPHQMWSTPDHEFLIIGDEWDEYARRHYFKDTKPRSFFWDISDLSAPRLLGEYVFDFTAIDHNLYVDDKGEYVYVNMYSAGVRVLDIRNLKEQGLEGVSEIAYFDTHTEEQEMLFYSGAWSSYIWFDGFIVTQTIDRGLFVIETSFKTKEIQKCRALLGDVEPKPEPERYPVQKHYYDGGDHETDLMRKHYYGAYDYYGDYIYWKTVAYLAICFIIIVLAIIGLMHCISKQSRSPSMPYKYDAV